jgi:nucleoside-diphosphate-sugar epimerase
MIERIRIVGARGRVGSAVSARLVERGIAHDAPDPSSSSVRPGPRDRRGRRETTVGPWIGHVSGATPLDALDPHVRRFGLHPLQSFSNARGPEQLDGAWAR